MAILNNNPLIGSGGNQGYNINNSVRLRSSASAYLSRTPASAGSQTTWTFSAWVKRGALGIGRFLSAGSASSDQFGFNSSDNFQFVSDTTAHNLVTSQVFRDPSAWYHVVVAFDTTQATAANRIKLYVNGSQVTAFSTATYPAQNSTTLINGNTAQNIGRRLQTAGEYFDGYMADTYFIDGQALTPSSFGETDTTTGVWKPKAYTGTYGTNGFYLKFSDIATTSGSNAGLGKDFSGNTNYWTTNNISVTSGTTYDAMTDSPTNTSATVANYALLNPLQIGAYVTASNGNLTLTGNTSTDSAIATATISFASGKYYYEYTQGTAASETCGFALVPVTGSLLDGETFATNNAFGARAAGTTYGTDKIASSLTSWASGDVVGIAIDADNGAAYWSKNGVWQTSGVPTSGASKTGAVAGWTPTSSSIVTPFFGAYNNGFINVNFGQRPFAYTPPTGYVALNTYNLPTPTILAGNKYMDATLYTGTGSSLNVTGVNFQPDFVWIKERSGVADHGLYDAIRGVQKQLESNTTTDETTETTGLTAFNSNGFTVGALAQLNTNTDTYVAWGWKETATSGFDIVTYTGNGSNRTISHSLGVAPRMIIVKARTTASTDQGWAVYHASNTTAPETDYLLLNSSAATADLDTVWNDTVPTSSVFSVGTNALVNTNNDTYVAYCWAEIAGFSKFTSYTGNGSSDGPFVYTGFRPKYLMIKSSSNSNTEWLVWDSSRNQYNSTNSFLYPNQNYDEYTGSAADLDFLSNGFKLRNANAGTASSNQSGYTYIVAAWAENPFKNSLAR